MGGHLSKAHQYAEPPELNPVGNKGRVVRRSTLEWDIVEASLQIYHADPLSLPKLNAVPPHVIELVLVLGCHFIDWYDVLAYPVKLPGLNAWY